MIIEGWQERRAAVYGENPDQLWPFKFSFINDDCVAVAMGNGLLTIVLKLNDVFVNGELRISMSSKCAAKPTESNVCEAVGVHYVAKTSKLQVPPRLENF